MDTMVPVHLKSFFYSFTRGSIALFNIVFKKINIQKGAHYIDPSFFKGRYKMYDVFFELIGKSGKVPAGQYKTSGVLTAPPEWGQVIPAGTDEQYAGSSLPYGSGLRDKRNPAAAIGKMAQQKMKGSIDSSIRANTRDQQSVIDQNDTEFLLSTS
ncbi:MAG TPA: hypothetical protein VL092_03345 [Chitinophagaceae bacterium]|nr:hypothetical protein [Chitinophagaceae bacterium]